MRKMLRIVACLLVAGGYAAAGYAQGGSTPTPPSVATSEVYAFLVKQGNLAPITQNTPLQTGDIVEYHTYFFNRSGAYIRSMNVDIVLPQGVEFAGSLAPRGAMASVDGTRFGFAPLRQSVGGQMQPTPLSRYKALRWRLEDFGVGGATVVKYRVRLL